jgi:flavin-binding protein dodecin
MLGFMTKDKVKDEEKNGDVKKYEAVLDDGTETSPVVKVIELIATSSESFDDAIAKGVATAAHSLRHISGADVKHMTVAVRNGKVWQYRVDLKVAFALEEDDDEEDNDRDSEDKYGEDKDGED